MIDRALTPAEHLGLLRDSSGALAAAAEILEMAGDGSVPAILTGAALERHLQIAGEAARLCDPSFAAAEPDVPWTALIEARNRLMHRDRLLPPTEVRGLAAQLVATAAAPLEAADAALTAGGTRRAHTLPRDERSKGRASAGAGGAQSPGFSPVATLSALGETLAWIRLLGEFERRDIQRHPVLLPAAMRGLQLAGEASRNLSHTIIGRAQDLPWQRLVEWRDRLAHDYAAVDEAAALRFVEVELPRFDTRLARLNAGLGADRRPRRDAPTPGRRR